MTNYLLISSTYRDRLLYPNPADFTVPFGAINNVNDNSFSVFNTTNPVTNSFPKYNNCWTNYHSVNPMKFKTSIVSLTGNLVSVDENVNTDLLGISNPNTQDPIVFHQTVEQCYDILKGFFLQIEVDGVTYSRLIEGYDPITLTIYLRTPFPTFEIDYEGYSIDIYNSFSLDPRAVPNSQFFLTINGDFLRNSPLIYYSSDIFIYNINKNEFRKTIQYDSTFHKYEIEKPFSRTVRDITDQFLLFGSATSSFCGNLTLLPNSSFYTYVPSSTLSLNRGSGYKSGMLVRLVSEQDTGDSFHVFELNSVNVSGQIDQASFRVIEIGNQTLRQGFYYTIQPIHSTQVTQFATIQVISMSVVFKVQFKNENPLPSSLVGAYFFPIVMSQQYALSGEQLHLQPNGTIIAKNKTSTSIDLLESQTQNGVCGIKDVISNNDYTYIVTQQYSTMKKLDILANAVVQNKIPDFATGITNFLILNFNGDGVVPLNYTGSQITNSQMSCYQLSVTSLILPNVILQSTSGLLTSSYPYLFVEISNETLPSSGNTDIIYSNNPYATKATFICPTLDVNNPETTKFIKIGSGSGSQIMKFSPFDNLKVKITLPNGQIFKTELDDNLIPNSPNPRIQMTLLLEIVKI